MQISQSKLTFRGKSLAMVVLCFAAIGVIVPFLYMIGSSLSSKEIIRTIPTSIIPIEGKSVTIDELGVSGEKYKVYRVEVDGEEREMAHVDRESPSWIYVDPDKPFERYALPPASPEDRVSAVVLNWVNFPNALNQSPFGRYILNTLFILVLATCGTVISTTLVGYGFSRFYFKGRNVLFLIVLTTMMLPSQVTLIPSFVMYNKLGWYNTYLPLIIPAYFAVSGYNIFLMRQFLMGIPTEFDDAAKIDGCGPIQTLIHIIVPQATPVLLTILLFTAVFWWNDYFYSLIYLHDTDKYTVSLGLQSFRSLYFNNTSIISAATVMMMVPPLLIFFFFQKYFIQGTVVSGIKG